MTVPRCIVLDGRGRRCPHPAALSLGDLYACTRHGRITLLVMADWCSSATRRMLAFARWNTAAEGQQWINRMHRRRVA